MAAATRTILGILQSLLSDVPADMKPLLEQPDLPPLVADSILSFAKKRVSEEIIAGRQLSAVLDIMQAHADEQYQRELDALPTRREKHQWHPDATRSFFMECGYYLPVRVHMREHLPDGRWVIRQFLAPLSLLPILDPAYATSVCILIEGDSEEYFKQNLAAKCVILPDDEADLLRIGVTHALNDTLDKLKFVTATRALFKDLPAVRASWQPLVDFFQTMLNTLHPSENPEAAITVDLRGYEPSDAVPLVFDRQDGATQLVINGYCGLMKDIREAFEVANASNDHLSRDVIFKICHELYHHARLASDTTSILSDSHAIDTRSDMLQTVMKLLERSRG